MATRRISVACIAHTRHNAFPRQLLRPHSMTRVGIPVQRFLSTTPIQYRQEANTKAKRAPAPVVVRGASKLYKDADSAVADLISGSTVLSAGFGLCGTAGEFTYRKDVIDSY